MAPDTRQRLLQTGMAMLLERGYAALGIQAVLKQTGIPKGSFYHHFKSKEDFALQAIDLYMTAVHMGLDMCLEDETRAPLDRVRCFFELSEAKYREEGYLGCLLGGLGQELSGTSDVFRHKIQWCFGEIARRISACLEQAQQQGDLAPDADPRKVADMLIDCWEGAALRSRLLRHPAPLQEMLDFYIGTQVRASRAAAQPSTNKTAEGARES
jgi:TetR/AcrR family transcriptional regulator, transcriptional repressor for nem operon